MERKELAKLEDAYNVVVAEYDKLKKVLEEKQEIHKELKRTRDESREDLDEEDEDDL